MVMKRETDASGNTKYGRNYKFQTWGVEEGAARRVLPVVVLSTLRFFLLCAIRWQVDVAKAANDKR